MNSSRATPVDAVVADRPAGDDRQAVERHRLGGDGAAGAAVPAGSLYVRLTRWAPIRSAHSGCIVATRRAHTRLVSTSSAAITHRGGRFASTEPGAITNVGATGAAKVADVAGRETRGATATRRAPTGGRGRDGCAQTTAHRRGLRRPGEAG